MRRPGPASGNKDITYVPTNGLNFPLQAKDLNGNPVVGGVLRDVTGLQEDGKAVDPFGALVQNVQPPTGGSPANMPVYGGTYGGVSWSQFTNANNFASGCTLDGVRTTCQNVLNQLAHGSADLISLSTTGTLADFINTLGTIPRSVSHSRWVNPSSDNPPHHNHEALPDDVVAINRDDKLMGHWEYWNEYIGNIVAAFGLDPQKTRVGADDLKAYRARIEKMINNKDCAGYIQPLLDEVKTQTGMSFGDILTTFDAIRFYWANTGGAHGGYSYWEEMGTVHAADIMNTLNTERMGGSRANQMDRRAFLISETTHAFLGETMHHLSQGGRMYSDPQMANALNAVLVRKGIDTHKDFPDKTEADTDNASRYWHRRVASACPAPRE